MKCSMEHMYHYVIQVKKHDITDIYRYVFVFISDTNELLLLMLYW